GLVWPPGSREAFLGDVRGLEMGSDHEVFEAAGFRVPMVYFHDYPDVTIHTQKDQPENLDATKLGRVAYMGAGVVYTLAALPDTDSWPVVVNVLADAESRVSRARAAAGMDAPLRLRAACESGARALEVTAALWPKFAGEAQAAAARLRRDALSVRPST